MNRLGRNIDISFIT